MASYFNLGRLENLRNLWRDIVFDGSRNSVGKQRQLPLAGNRVLSRRAAFHRSSNKDYIDC